MIDEYQKKYRIPSLTTDAIVLRKRKSDPYHDILLVTRGNYPEEGKLAFPGGFVEYGENPENGCIRELKEETELDGKNIELLTVRGDPKRDPRRHIVSIFYVVTVDENAEPKGGDDAKDAKFYDLKNILENEKNKIAFDHYGVIVELVEKKFKNLYCDNNKNKFNIILKGNNIYPIKNDNIDSKCDKNNYGEIFDMYLKEIKNLKINEIKINDKIGELYMKKNYFEKFRENIKNSYNELLTELNTQYKYLNKLLNDKLNNYSQENQINKLTLKNYNKDLNVTKKVEEKNVDKNKIKKVFEKENKLEQKNDTNHK